MPIPAGGDTPSSYPVTRWIEDTKRHLYGNRRPMANRLTSALDAATDTFTVDFDVSGSQTAISEGTVLSVDAETMWVWSVNAANRTVTVQRGYGGSTAAAHAAKSIVLSAPRWTDFDILCAINNDLASLSAAPNGLYRIVNLDKTFDSLLLGYDLASDMLEDGLIDVRWHLLSPQEEWVQLYGWIVQAGMPTTDFPSGNALRITERGTPGQTFRIRYRAPLNTVAYTDDASVSGLNTSAYDLPPLGAALALMSPAEIWRDDPVQSGDPQHQQQVPPGAVINSFRGLAALRQQRVAEEASRLSALSERRMPRR